MQSGPPHSETVPVPTRRGLSRVEAAGYIGVSPTTFDRLVSDARMPKPKRIFSRSVWDVRQLDSAFEALDSGSATSNPWD
jgi:predicted DNA-binding transcriptional regulator AlpA